MTPAEAVGIGLVGAGAYGAFCLAAFADVPQVRIVAVGDSDAARAETFAHQYAARAYTTLDALLADPAVAIVALNTPPFLHAAQGLAVLSAGKHLFCEKPLALTVDEGAALLDAAQRRGLRLTVDYVMRRNPLWAAAARIRESGVLGALLHMDLSNHAAGLSLPAAHWFWDKAQSGGIWVEHGVHFFDAFAWVAGTAGRISSAAAQANAQGQEDRVEALAQYGQTLAHFYHGFTHSGETEQTTVRLTFAQGYLTLREWVPTRLDIAAASAEHAQALLPLLPDTAQIAAQQGRRRLAITLPEGKPAVYRASVQAGMRELAWAVRDPALPLAVTGEHGLASLRMAVDAERLSRAAD